MYEKKLKLLADTDYLYEISEDKEGKILKMSKIPLQEIIFVVCSEFRKDYFEIFLKNGSRFVYKVLNNERNIIIGNILDIITEKVKNREEEILLLSYKPRIEYRISGFINDEVDMDYENKLVLNLQNFINEEKIREKIIEDICVNFCFRSKKFKLNPIVNKKLLQTLYEVIPRELGKITEIQRQEVNTNNNKNFSKRLSVLNYYLILIRNVVRIYHSEKLIGDLFDLVEAIPSQIIFYNIFLIYRNLLLNTSKSMKKDEIAQRKWMISSHFDNSVKIKNILFNKIFDFKTKQKIYNYEENNVKYFFYIH